MEMIVRGNVYALDMWMTNEIDAYNVRIVRVEEFHEVKERIRKEGRLYKTAEILVDASGATRPEDAVAYADKELQDYSTLISFSQGHDVPIGDLSCERVIRPLMGRTGRPEGAIIIDSSGLSDFLTTALPLVRDTGYSSRTGIVRAIHFYNAAVNLEYAVVEMQQPLYFAGLEILANAHYSVKPKSFVLDEQTWDSFQVDLGKMFDQKPIYLPAKNRVFGSVGFARASISDKIENLASSLGLPDYTAEIAAIVKMRNDILHGRTISTNYEENQITDTLLKSRRLLEKMILKLLDFYDRDHVHGAFSADDLRATS